MDMRSVILAVAAGAALPLFAGEYDEIVEQNFPAGATAMEPSAYVQTGLVGNFDAIRNAGLNLPHDNSATTWKNLVTGGADATRTVRSGKTPVGWKDSAYSFNEDAMFIIGSTINLGTNFTVQIAITATPSDQGNSSDASTYNSWFNNHPKGNYGFWTYGTEDKMVGNFNLFVPSGTVRPLIQPWGGRYVTWMLDGTNRKCYTFNTAEIPSGTSLNVTKNPGALTYCWGAEKSGNTYQAFVKGDYHSVRMYNRPLTNDEHVWNRIVDEVRYRNVITNGTVVVASNRAGAEGTEVSGMYYVNGNHTFTAPATVTIDGCVYEPTGYKLERWNPTGNGWDFDCVVSSTSFAYTNCEANTGARITWDWRLKSGVKKIDADDYMQAGLLLGFDGIRNAGLGTAHDDNATTWANIGSLGGDATTETFDTSRPGAWTAKGYRFTGGDCFVTPIVKFGRQATMQVAVDYNESLQTATSQWPAPFGVNTDKDHFGVYTYRKYATDRGDEVRFYSRLTDQLPTFYIWDGRFVNAIGDYYRSSATSVAAPEWTGNHAFNEEVPESSYCIGTAWKSAGSRQARSFSGMIHAIRLYDRVLTEAELAHNMEIDNIRFYAGAGRYSGSNLVEVAVESPGGVVTVDEAGCWLVRGEGASKTFTASATVTVGNSTYSCTGYRLETWNATKRMWENPVETAESYSAELNSTNANRRITWLYSLTSGIRTAADYDVGDYVQKGLVANYDGIRNLGPGNGHATMSQRWRDSSYRDVPMIAASNSAHRAWVGYGHHFTASEDSFFEMTEPISLGQEMTIQTVLDVTASQQTKSYPCYVGFGMEDRSFFTRGKGTTMEVKLDDWVGPRTTFANWGGKYFTYALDSAKIYMLQGTEYGSGTARTKYSDMPNNRFAIGAPNSYPSNFSARDARAMTGDYYALRIYSRKLTETELAHNMTVDEIRYRGNFTNANVTVVCEVPFEGVEAPVSMPAGDYEVAGSFTFTASSLTVGESTFSVRYTIETWDGSEWGEPEAYEGPSYTYTEGAKVRLTWKWDDPTVPVKATWTGLGDASNLLDTNNWRCVNAGGETIAAAPTNVTTVVIDGTTGFSIPEGVTTFPWKEIKFGSPDAHVATRCGNYKIATSSGFTEAPVGMFAVMSAANTSLANLNGGNTSWQTSNLKTSRVRYDGWFYVAAAQAGTWTVTQMFDDYFGFAIDGEWIVVNHSYVNSLNTTVDVAEGWHRFTIVCGDSAGSYGSTDTSCVVVNGVNAPMSISWGGAAVAFTESNFTFGGEGNVVTLTNDCNWSALGDVFIANGAKIDLNGHNLTLASVSADAIGAAITNSNNAVTSIVTFVAGEGVVVTNDGAAICGNVKVVKEGLGTYVSMAGASTHTGGTFIDEGTAMFGASGSVFGPNGSDVNVALGAAIDANDKDVNAHCIVLEGGSLLNTAGPSAANHTIGNIRLTADSEFVFDDVTSQHDWLVANNAVWDLGGHELTVRYAGNDPDVYYVSSGNNSATTGKLYIRNGTVKTVPTSANKGWWHDTRTDGTTGGSYDFDTPLRHFGESTVSNLTFRTTNSSVNGTGIYNVYGTFTPLSQYGHNVKMLDGSTIDLTSKAGAWSTSFTSTYAVTFNDGAVVTIKLAGREDLTTLARAKGLVVTWDAANAPSASVRFQVDAETKAAGFKVVRDDAANGLRFRRSGGFTIIVR